MAEQPLVKVEGVSKKFCRSLKRSLWYGVQDVGNELLGRKGGHDELRKNEFWAVNDVSFELKRGECLGLIGPNGAGKSTLLKMLNGLVKPDKGRITMRGRVGALIELGAGFNPILTARENIYVNGSVLGFSKNEIDKKFDAIVDFSEVDEFLDTPVQNFSSGMKVRLGFAVAAQMEPDVLIVDEVLAVGDAPFRMKCLNEISRLTQKCATILVSHSMPMISRVSTIAMSISKGTAVNGTSPVAQAIEDYLSHVKSNRQQEFSAYGISVSHFELNGQIVTEDDRTLIVNTAEKLSGIMTLDVSHTCPDCFFNLAFVDMEGKVVAQSLSLFSNFVIPSTDQKIHIQCDIETLPLNPGRYVLQIGLVEALGKNGRGAMLYRNLNLAQLVVRGPVIGWAPVQLPANWQLLVRQ